MFDINKHRFFLVRILKDIYSDLELANYLGFKGGTAMMFFYGLPRFSVDLDFDLIYLDKERIVYEKVRNIILNYGKVHDEARKFFGPLIVLDYGQGERKMKVEISSRRYKNRYEIKNLLGFSVKVMLAADMFAHKLCALLDRKVVTNRDIFDTWFFLKNRTAINPAIVEFRMNVSLSKHIENCISKISIVNKKRLLDGVGELMEDEMKKFVRTKLLDETVELLNFYKAYPILAE